MFHFYPDFLYWWSAYPRRRAGKCAIGLSANFATDRRLEAKVRRTSRCEALVDTANRVLESSRLRIRSLVMPSGGAMDDESDHAYPEELLDVWRKVLAGDEADFSEIAESRAPGEVLPVVLAQIHGLYQDAIREGRPISSVVPAVQKVLPAAALAR